MFYIVRDSHKQDVALTYTKQLGHPDARLPEEECERQFTFSQRGSI